ncbi:bifunctional biotin--[acetyl-CoA-carboxylase] ligase/biotin operon repressor BirA [Candidatus Curculioniphilus buchneri]|uniref:bifunctional biotin--[acetyl-CoA-carboxylase] ligase/biotin operon repressor BirA n=1 Tax=Candidatus Curculioniphilus buchneri TaxID=690594 RepID=UPI00376EB16B
MKDSDILLKLIHTLANDGKSYSNKQLCKVLEGKIHHIDIDNYVKILKDGVNIFNGFKKDYYLDTQCQCLDKRKILTYLSPSKSRVTVLSVVDSTNQYLLERISSLRSGDVCTAEYQIQGRGQHDRRWISPFGKNICLSFYWRLENRSEDIVCLSLMVGIVLAETLQRLGAKDVRLKWPNDLYVNDKKLGGILVEISGKAHDVSHVVIGVGINLTMQKSMIDIIGPNWTTLSETGIIINRNTLISQLINALRLALQQFEYEGFKKFIHRWQALDNFFNRPVKLFINDLEIIGIARGINSQGAILLEQQSKINAYLARSISLRSL